MKKIKTILIVVAAVALAGGGFWFARLLDRASEPGVNATSIREEISRCSELATARLDYRGLIKYSDGDIPLINQKSFSMIYDATIRAGIDLSQAEVEVSGNTITVTLPAPQILDITVDPDSLEFYDEQFALFNWTDKEDTTEAMSYAREDAEEKAGQEGLLEEASEQAKNVIETLVISGAGDYQVEFIEK